MFLCCNSLPWVDSLVHLGTTVTNKIYGCQQDIKQKIARYIDKNWSLNQEFSFAHPSTKIKLNNIYNCHFSGSQDGTFSTRGQATLKVHLTAPSRLWLGFLTNPQVLNRTIIGNWTHETKTDKKLPGVHQEDKIIKQTSSKITVQFGKNWCEDSNWIKSQKYSSLNQQVTGGQPGTQLGGHHQLSPDWG